jgi:hypothetical protein
MSLSKHYSELLEGLIEFSTDRRIRTLLTHPLTILIYKILDDHDGFPLENLNESQIRSEAPRLNELTLVGDTMCLNESELAGESELVGYTMCLNESELAGDTMCLNESELVGYTMCLNELAIVRNSLICPNAERRDIDSTDTSFDMFSTKSISPFISLTSTRSSSPQPASPPPSPIHSPINMSTVDLLKLDIKNQKHCIIS